MSLMASQAGFDYLAFVEEILKGARLRAHGRQNNRRIMQVAFDGPDRRASAVPDAH